MGKTEQRLAEMGLSLPALAGRGESVTPIRQAGRLLYIGAVLSREKGRACTAADVPLVRQAGRETALRMLALLQDALGTLDLVDYCVKAKCLIRSGGAFDQMPAAANGFSYVLCQAFGEAGLHARSAMGVPELPGGALLSADLIVALREGVHAD